MRAFNPALAPCLGIPEAPLTQGRSMDKERAGELEGQTSINELLDEPVGTRHIQLALTIHVQLESGIFRRLA